MRRKHNSSELIQKAQRPKRPASAGGPGRALPTGPRLSWSEPAGGGVSQKSPHPQMGRKGRSGSTSLRSLPHPKTLTRREGASVPGTRPLGRPDAPKHPRMGPGAEAVSDPCPVRRERWPRNPPGPLHAQHLRVQPPGGTGGRGEGSSSLPRLQPHGRGPATSLS